MVYDACWPSEIHGPKLCYLNGHLPALACTMRTLRGRWLNIRCRCGYTTLHPVRLMLKECPECAGQTLADVLVNLRCRGCQGRSRLTIHLCEHAHGVGSLPRATQPGWALLLHDGAGAESPRGRVIGFVPMKPDGTCWQRAFASKASAWRVVTVDADTVAQRPPSCDLTYWTDVASRRHVTLRRCRAPIF